MLLIGSLENSNVEVRTCFIALLRQHFVVTILQVVILICVS